MRKEPDNLIIELPFANWLDASKCARYCGNCFKLTKASIKCKRCEILNYCSSKCLDLDFNHQIECDYLHILTKFGIFHMAIRILMKEFVLDKIDNGIDSEIENKSTNEMNNSDNHDNKSSKIEKISAENINHIKSSNFLNNSQISNSLINFYSLACLVDSNEFTVLICFAIASIFTSKFLHLIYDFKLNNSEFQISIKLLQIALILKQNAMEVYDEFNNLSIGHALYLTCSLLNHTCIKPNCNRYFNGNEVIIQNLTEISANSELTISYGLNSNLNFKARREQLKERFGFDCLCVDCKEDEKVEQQ